MNSAFMLKRLVENALGFLDKAADDLAENPKFSLISFYTSVELFLKARLMMEHWSLVVASKHEPDIDKFQRGDFQSVTLDTANERLTKIAKSGLTAAQLRVFKEVAIHRNQTVHFFHAASTKKVDEARASIVKHQLTAWYVLHGLLKGQWEKEFSKWEKEISRVDKRLRKQKEYLEVIFENKGEDIAELKAAGALVLVCPSCGFKSKGHNKSKDIPYRSDCVVCGLEDICVAIDCDDCDRTMRFAGEGYAKCKCGKDYDPPELANHLTDLVAAHIAAMDGDYTENANCSECDGYHTVVSVNEQYFCTECFGLFQEIEFCGSCGEGNTGDMEHSAWNGCNHCDGRGGWDREPA